MGYLFAFTVGIIFVFFSGCQGSPSNGSAIDVDRAEKARFECRVYGRDIISFNGKTGTLNSSCINEENIFTSYVLTKSCNDDPNTLIVTGINLGTKQMKLKAVFPVAGATITAEYSETLAEVDVFVNEKREPLTFPHTVFHNGHQIRVGRVPHNENIIVIETEVNDQVYFDPLQRELSIFLNRPDTKQICGLCV